MNKIINDKKNKKTFLDKLSVLTVHSIPIFIILTSVLFVFSFKSLYYFDIDHLDLVRVTGYSKELIARNYNYVVDYCLSPINTNFNLPDLPSSNNGITHFKDVKKLLQNLIKINFLFLFTSIYGIIYTIKKEKYEYFKLVSVNIFLVPVLLSIPFALNFYKSFEVFHKIFFRNDYWLFDSTYDPIISILPEEFFFHSAVFILVILILFSLVFYLFSQKLKDSLYVKKGSNNERDNRNTITGSKPKS